MLEIIKPGVPHDLAQDIISYFRDDETMSKQYESVPDFMIRDIFNSYATSYEEMKYDGGEQMNWWFDMLQTMNNYLLKTVTQNKIGYSFITLKHIMKLLAKVLDEEDQDNDCQDGKGPQKKGQNQSIHDKLRKGMDKAVQEANQEITEKQASDDLLGGDSAGKTPTEMSENDQKIEQLKDVILNQKMVSKFIKRSIKGFKTGFGVKNIVTEEDLFDSEEMDDMLDEHYLADSALFEDIAVRDIKSQMTSFDLYIDISGSMSSNIYFKDGSSVNRLNMAMALALKMNQMKCLGDIYTFDTRIDKISKEKLFYMRPRGGTNIEMVMKEITKTKRASVILTDGEDCFETYTPDAFIMSIIEPGGYQLQYDNIIKMVKAKKYIVYKDNQLVIPKLKNQKAKV